MGASGPPVVSTPWGQQEGCRWAQKPPAPSLCPATRGCTLAEGGDGAASQGQAGEGGAGGWGIPREGLHEEQGKSFPFFKSGQDQVTCMGPQVDVRTEGDESHVSL